MIEKNIWCGQNKWKVSKDFVFLNRAFYIINSQQVKYSELYIKHRYWTYICSLNLKSHL